MPLLSFKKFTLILLINMVEPTAKRFRLESFLDSCVPSIQPTTIVQPSSPSEVNLHFAGL